FQVTLDNYIRDVQGGSIQTWIKEGDSIRVSASIPGGASLQQTRLYTGEDTLRFDVQSNRSWGVNWTAGRVMNLNYETTSATESETGLLTWTVLEASRT